MKVATYARYSSENQREESIEAQLAAIEEYCEKEKHIIIARYIDRALSATTDDRPDFLRMISDAEKGLFEVVIIHKLDRFARNRYDSAFYKRKLKLAGIKLISVTERLDDTPESIILESVLEGMAEYYSKNLAREVMKGLRENAKEAKFTGGRPPLGYDVKDLKYVINEEEAKIVRMIFDLYLQDKGYTEIINTLNLHGYKTKKGNQFTKNSLHDLIRNPIYAGYFTYCRGTKKKHRYVNRDDTVVIPDAVPAIITKEEYEKVKERMKKTAKGPGKFKAKNNYTFTSLMECAKCGNKLIGKPAKGKLYYHCGLRRRGGECKGVSISQDDAENIIFSYISNTIFANEKLDELVNNIYQVLYENYNEKGNRKKDILTRINELEKEQQNIINAIAAGFPLERLRNKAQEMDKSLRYLRQELAEIEASEPPIMSKEEIKNYLLTQKEKLFNPEDKKAIAREYVQKIKVHDDKIEIFFNLPIIDPVTHKVCFWVVAIDRYTIKANR